MILLWKIWIFSSFFLFGRRWDVSDRGKSDGRSAQCWKADIIQMFPGRCAQRENRTLPSPIQETMNTVCLTTAPVCCFYLRKTSMGLKPLGWWERQKKSGGGREWRGEETMERRIEVRCAGRMMPVAVLSKLIRTFRTVAYDNAIMQINQHHSSSCLARCCWNVLP